MRRGSDVVGADLIPTQSTAACFAAVRTLALATEPTVGVAVELGAWLGAMTAAMAEANPELEIHAFDRFVVDDPRAIGKARRQGVTLELGQALAPLVRAALARYPRVHLHPGEISEASWDGGPIALHVDDACKQPPAFAAALRTFAPSWVPRRTHVVLLDFYFPGAGCQRDWARAHRAKLKQVSEFPAVFRYFGGRVC
jgi:hypothetical protein